MRLTGLDFYPRSPCGERRAANSSSGKSITISIHALLAESDKSISCIGSDPHAFLSTLSLRRATQIGDSNNTVLLISIHALLAESDFSYRKTMTWLAEFLSTLSLRRATVHIWRMVNPNPFLSTLSLRRATLGQFRWVLLVGYFYPRSPCGERQCTPSYSPTRCYFYPRSPCGERRHLSMYNTSQRVFLSTLSLRRATINEITYQRQIDQFLSTLSLRRATSMAAVCQTLPSISIHALLAESDLGNVVAGLPMLNFYPRSPCGERRRGAVSVILII